MKQVLTTTDPIEITFAKSLLADAGIESFVLHAAMSSMYSGAIPQIISVIDEDEAQARAILTEHLKRQL
ncbi:MAG: DUF2007 domain-containing protein [Maricaulis sp.]|jgi:hypothetical protein|nr:DUF2007 domain-containing protein [Maricaulis sp.]MDG2057341.1 DUF2007 domain-containing protein [Tateyamaria sp.]